MHSGLQNFLRQTAIYTVGNVIYRGASFLLIPIYVHRLTPTEYGALEIIYVTSAIFQTALAAGLPHSTLRYYFEYDRPEEKNAVISTMLIASFVIALPAVGILFLFAPSFSSMFFGSQAYALALRLAFLTLVLEISREISLAFVRAKEKAGLFIVVAIIQLVVQVSVNVYTVVILHLGVNGVLMGNFLATGAIWMILTSYTLRICGFRIEQDKFWSVLKYGSPLMLSGLGSTAMENADRYLLNFFASLNATGIFALGARLSNVVPVLLLDPFTKSFGPYRFSIMKQDGVRTTYANILRYYLIASCFATLGLWAFTEEVVRAASSPEYWAASKLIPLLLVLGPLGGVNYCLQTGIYVQKRTNYIFHITIASGALNLVLAFLLIPRRGFYGAAWANLLSNLVAMGLTYVLSQRVYPVNYEFGRLAKIAVLFVALGLITSHIHFSSLLLTILVKLSLVVLFPLALMRTNACSPLEIQKVGEALRSLRMKIQSGAAVS